MMSAPFFVLTLGYLAIWAGKRALALWLWAFGVIGLLTLFTMDITDKLNITL